MDRVTMSYLALLVLGILAREASAEAPERIVGGDRAALGEMSYLCSIRVNNNHICGGNIISARHILTAAHCVDDWVESINSHYTVVCGTNNLNRGGQTYNVKTVIVHPDYKGTRETSWKNDIAVMVLKNLIFINNYAKPIDISMGVPDYSVVSLSGWGLTEAEGKVSNTLLKINLFIMDNSSCQKYHKLKIDESQICAINRKGIGACQGDSGGAIISDNKLVGLTSWVIPCALGFPDVYTNVSYHINFVKKCMLES